MRSVTKQELEMLCDEVFKDAPALLAGVTDDGERSDRLLCSLYDKICKHLHLDPQEQASGLGNSAGFLLMQTLEEHMASDFQYTTVLDERLLVKVQATSQTRT